jgi:hypothetical protein
VIDLPTIVEAIRRQRPGVVPEWLCAHSFSISPTLPREEAYGIMAEFFGSPQQGSAKWIPKEAAQVIIEAVLWRAYMKALNPLLIDWDGRPGQPGVVGWYTDSIRRGRTIHGTGKFALVRALCHAIGIEVGDA